MRSMLCTLVTRLRGAFGAALKDLPRPVLGYCRTGTRSATLWSLHEAKKRPLPEILAATKAAGYDMSGVARRIANGGRTPTDTRARWSRRSA